METDPAVRDGQHPRLLDQRDQAERCLTDGSAALEAVLGELERLRAGTGSVTSVSERLNAAIEIGEAVDRMLAARNEASQATRNPPASR